MSKNTVYLLLGSNKGDRADFLDKTVKALENAVGNVVACSQIYETQAWGNTEQSDFLNQAIQIETLLSAPEVLTKTQKIELEMGRDRAEKWGARTLDIDILLFNNSIIEGETLTVPHKSLHERNFVLVPLMEIAGETIHPILEKTIEEIYFDCADTLEVLIYEPLS
jgi:2-amino-4-hydroxy-6-hydroxymethyldihydropteridine diphosphokinase